MYVPHTIFLIMLASSVEPAETINFLFHVDMSGLLILLVQNHNRILEIGYTTTETIFTPLLRPVSVLSIITHAHNV